MPVLRRSHEHHRDLQARLDTASSADRSNHRRQDRYVMITFPTSQIQNPDLPRRPSIRNGGAPANLPSRRQRRHRSSWLTADFHTCDRPIMRRNVVSQHTHRRRLPSPSSVLLGARRATACHFPRVPSLKASGRRPRCKPHRCHRPASETLNNSGRWRRASAFLKRAKSGLSLHRVCCSEGAGSTSFICVTYDFIVFGHGGLCNAFTQCKECHPEGTSLEGCLHGHSAPDRNH